MAWRAEGRDVPLAARIAQLAEFVEVAFRAGGVEAVKSVARERAGKQFDPELAELICANGETIFDGLDDIDTWEAVIGAEPQLTVVLSWDRFDAALLALANFVDLKSPYSLGHSSAVADLAAQAGPRLGLAEADVRALRRAGARARLWAARGLERDLGQARTARRGRVGAWVRLHPYLTERMLQQSAVLAPLGADRGTASRSASTVWLSASALRRVNLPLGPDPRRRRRLPSDARTAPAPARANGGRGCCRAPRRCPGRSPRCRGSSRRFWAPLVIAFHDAAKVRQVSTPREVEVLILLARGLSNKEIAKQLVISPKTAGNHIEHIYSKIGASTRAKASLFADAHTGLLPEEKFVPEPAP